MKSQAKKKEFMWVYTPAIFLIITRAFDAYTTYLYTPDMSKEGNPIMVALGWKNSLLLQLLACIFLGYCNYKYYTSKIKVPRNNTKILQLTFSEFISFFHYRNTESLIKNSLFKVPLIKPLIHGLGYIATNTLIFAGILVGTSTSMLINISSYRQYYSEYRIPFVLMGIILLAFCYFANKFYKKQYQEFKSINNLSPLVNHT